jgi:hypothetical protein
MAPFNFVETEERDKASDLWNRKSVYNSIFLFNSYILSSHCTVIEGIGMAKYIELIYVEKSVYIKYRRGPTIENL